MARIKKYETICSTQLKAVQTLMPFISHEWIKYKQSTLSFILITHTRFFLLIKLFLHIAVYIRPEGAEPWVR
jgi:hypothetical protein